MTDVELSKYIKDVVRQEITAILMGKVTSNDSQVRTSIQRFPSETPLHNLRNMQPYGHSSRAPVGTQTLVVPINGDPTHMVAAAHYDPDRPTGADGETLLYDAHGHVVYLSESKIQIGSKAADEPAVLGNVFKTMMDTLLDALSQETHIGNLGYATSPPVNAASYSSLKESPIDDKAILSDSIFVEKGT